MLSLSVRKPVFLGVAAALTTISLGAPPSFAKSPPSAFGSSFDKESASGGSPRDDADVDVDKPDYRRPAKERPSYSRPRVRQRVKTILDGGVGRDPQLENDDDW